MKIIIKNCNNIDSGEITIEESKLNIKFGSNGIGKSTLAEAIRCKIEEKELNSNQLPFKLQKENPNNLKSEVIIKDGKLESVLSFNEKYVKQYLFKADELLSNSFEILVKTPKYIETEEKIEKQLGEIKKIFLNNEELDRIILDFENLSKSFKTTKDGLSDASAISKGVNSKFYDIPSDLKEFEPFIQDKEKCVSWLGWHTKGANFIEGHDNCPFCVASIDEIAKAKIKSISDIYDANVIKNFIEIINVLENSGDYFSPKTSDELKRITQKTELLPEEKVYITTVKGQIDSFLLRLKNLKDISFHNLKDEKIDEKIEGFIIKIDESFDKLNSDKTIKIIDNFNASLKGTLTKVTELQKNIGIQVSEIGRSINENKKSINQFLKNAGYKYQVSIETEGDQHKIKLQHIDHLGKNISGGDQCLSFGERNAFALVLFMCEAISKNSDLIILDDPISSFDKNKKYAILQMLFREDKSFKGETVLMLTHDIEPVIDSVKVLHREFKDQTNANFIGSKKGVLKEQDIKKDDILTFSQIFQSILDNENVDEISKLVYMRRNFEILNDKGNGYQVLSDLFHKRTKEEAKAYRKEKYDDLSDEDFEENFKNGENIIKEIKGFSDFDYEKMFTVVNDKSQLKAVYNKSENGYEKLQIFRIINGEFTKNDDFSDVFKKFINETYHIENDFIHQLNPQKYDLIPEFIIEECDEFIEGLSN